MKLRYKDTHALMSPQAHGRSHKTLGVLHETVSPDLPGWRDINDTEAYLAAKGYGIHGMTDAEGNIAWALGLGASIFYHAGGVNTEAVGIEQVSNIMLRSPNNKVRRKLWVARNKQLRATAKLIACIKRAQNIPIELAVWDGSKFGPGWTSHYDVSKHYAASEGHSDCWPVNEAGYFPMAEVLTLARGYYKLGYSF